MPPWCWFYPDLHWPSLLSRAPGIQPKCHALSSWPHIHCMNLEIFNLWYKASPQSGSAPQTRSFLLFLCLPLIYPMCATCDLLQAPCDVFFHKRLFITQKLTDYITVSMKGDTVRRTLFLFLKVFRTRWSQFNEFQEKKINKTKTCPSGYVTFPAHSKIISLFLGILHSAKEVFIIKIRGLIYFL